MRNLRNIFVNKTLLIVAVLILTGAAEYSHAENAAEPKVTYSWIKQLEGQWILSAAEWQEVGTKTHPSVVGLLDTDKVAMEFKLIGRNMTVQEDLLPGTKRHMVTMYHCRDSSCSAVKATHYCAKGNHPEFLASSESSSQELIFDCDMSTALCQSQENHIHRITHQLSEDGRHLRAVYSNFNNGAHTKDTIFHFNRKE